MTRALSLVALLAAPLVLSACNRAGESSSQAARPAPTGITSSRGGGAQALGNTGVGNPIAVAPTTPVR